MDETQNSIVNHLMRKCRNLEPADLMKSGFKGNAISCAKIRSYLGELLDPDQCACDFSGFQGSYPSPLLHLNSLNQSHNQAPLTNDLKINDLINAYLSARKQSKEVSQNLDCLTRDLNSAFEEIGVDRFDTPYGTLVKTEMNGSIRYTLELK